jgi:large conductance mechanosensitive channel
MSPKGTNMLNGFKKFILKGNAVDMAVGVVVGVAFSNVVTALVEDLITPLIGAFGGSPDFSGIFFTINHSKFMIGDFINSIFSFLTVSATIYFAVVLPTNKLMEKMNAKKTVTLTEKTCPECLSFIPVKAKKCKFCGSRV